MSDLPTKVGDAIVFHDPSGKAYNALVCAVHSPDCINLKRLRDEGHTDNQGRQVYTETSVQHISVSGVHGFNWRFPHEEPNPVKTPQEV